MGFSDLGCYGGEIDTPHLDALAAGGLRFSQFYNTARCCPTRASLLTGLHPAQAGIGHMTNSPEHTKSEDRGVPGYRGDLSPDTATLAEVLRSAGYATMMAGKWHVGMVHADTHPLARGFERYYGILAGATNYFHPAGARGLTLQDAPVEPVSTTARPYYTTDAFTDYAIQFVEGSLKTDPQKPFFLYLAYNAPHWPLQAPQDVIDKYRQRYRTGWTRLRNARFARQREIGLFPDPAAVKLTPHDSPLWDRLTDAQRDEMDLRMAIYAAQVEVMDRNIGRLVASLKAAGRLDDTLILFLSDNGGCAEGGMFGSGNVIDPEKRNAGYFVNYGQAWANLSNTPFRKYKHFTQEGGIATPLIAHWPAGIPAAADGQWRRQSGYLPDVMATLVDVGGATYPRVRDGHPVPPMQGVSLRPALAAADGDLRRGRPMFWEHEGNRAVRDGDLKLVSTGPESDYGGPGSWALYDLSTDRSETRDLAPSRPAEVKRLADLWWAWAVSHQVIPNGKGTATRPAE